jgi:hypothetical protein
MGTGNATSALGSHRIHHLSDIREVSDSSKAATSVKATSIEGMKELPSTPVRQREESSVSDLAVSEKKPVGQKVSVTGLGSRATSAMSLPLRDVPERRSSISIFSKGAAPSRKPSLQEVPSWRVPPSTSRYKTVPNRGRSNSPVRTAIDRSMQSSEANRPSPLHTVIRTAPRTDLLDKATVKNDRMDLSVHLPSPLFVGGGTIEGHITMTVDNAALVSRKRLKAVSVTRLCIDVVGVEEVSDGRRWAFLSLGTDLFNEDNPPPTSLIDSRSPKYNSELGWVLKPASATIPFCINLPLNLGPPPYVSKQACIRYILCPTAYIAVGEKRAIVRQSWNIQMLTVHDPEKALSSLPSPLLATDALVLSQSADPQTVRVTAGLHRQTWVNGSVIFVDIHVINSSSKTIKKVEVQLEKTTLWYTHAAAGTAEKSASHLRLPKRSDSEIVNTTVIKKNKDWSGIHAHSSEVRTCPLEVPRGHVTISTGRYFEVRYFINVVVSVSMFKSCAVQLPVTLIHINSLDVLPNSLAQVAASIEAKRSRTVPMQEEQYQKFAQGQAFAAPRRQSLDKAHPASILASNDVSLLTQELDHSPRRYGSRGRSTRQEGENVSITRSHNPSASHNHTRHHPSCYHCHLLYDRQEDRPATSGSRIGPRLPRLQVSTSGLGFSESEFEMPVESPKKVMLSEQERKMINQQRELKLQRQYSLRQRKVSVGQEARHYDPAIFQSWRNVAADSEPFPGRLTGPLQDLGPAGHNVPRKPLSGEKGKGKEPVRTRSNSNPQRAGSISRTGHHRPSALSADFISSGSGQSDGPVSRPSFRRVRHNGSQPQGPAR